jgi:hypothetical protein
VPIYRELYIRRYGTHAPSSLRAIELNDAAKGFLRNIRLKG